MIPETERRDRNLHNSTMKMMRVMAKQKLQMATGQLPMAPLPSAHAGYQREGHSGGEQLQQAEEVEHGVQGLGMSTWWNDVMTARQLMVTAKAVVFTGDHPENDPAPEVD